MAQLKLSTCTVLTDIKTMNDWCDIYDDETTGVVIGNLTRQEVKDMMIALTPFVTAAFKTKKDQPFKYRTVSKHIEFGINFEVLFIDDTIVIRGRYVEDNADYGSYYHDFDIAGGITLDDWNLIFNVIK